MSTEYAYFSLCIPSQKRTAFIRMEPQRVDAEWKDMCSDEFRKYPCVVFHRDKPESTPLYENVTLSWLRPVKPETAMEVEREWYVRDHADMHKDRFRG